VTGTTVILVFAGLAWIPFMKYVSPQVTPSASSRRTSRRPIRRCSCSRPESPVERKGRAGALWLGLCDGFAAHYAELKGEVAARISLYWSPYPFPQFSCAAFPDLQLHPYVVVGWTPPPAAERVADLTLKTVAVGRGACETTQDSEFEISCSVSCSRGDVKEIWIVFRLSGFTGKCFKLRGKSDRGRRGTRKAREE